MNLLVTNIHTQQAYATILALRPHAEKVVVSKYVTGGLLGRLPHAAYSRFIDKRYSVPSPVADWQVGNIQPDNTKGEEAYVKALEAICEAEGIDTIYPSWDPDVYVLSKNKDRFASMGVLIPVPDIEISLAALDKYRTIEAARKIGFPCPRTYLYEDEKDARDIAAREEFPLVIKPRFTSGSRGMSIVQDLPDLLGRLSFEQDGRYKPMIQEYIPGGRRESFQFVLDGDGRPGFLFHKKRLRNFRVNQRFGTVSKSATLPPYCPDAIRLMQSLQWWGAGGIEVLLDPRDGAWKLLEINARFSRQLWNRTEMDINEPWMCLEIARGKKYPETLDYPVDALFVNPVEDVMLYCLQMMDSLVYRLRRRFRGKETFDPLIAPPTLRELTRDFLQTYQRGQNRVLDPLTRHFFQDPLVALIWWLEFTTWMGGACKQLGR